jgi:hypothetical protein
MVSPYIEQHRSSSREPGTQPIKTLEKFAAPAHKKGAAEAAP